MGSCDTSRPTYRKQSNLKCIKRYICASSRERTIEWSVASSSSSQENRDHVNGLNGSVPYFCRGWFQDRDKCVGTVWGLRHQHKTLRVPLSIISMKEDNSSPANKTYPGTIQRPIFRVKISQPLITWQCTGSPFPWRRPPNFHGLMPNQRWLEATHFEASLRIFLVGEGSLYAD